MPCQLNQFMWGECASCALTAAVGECLEFKYNTTVNVERMQHTLADEYDANRGGHPFVLADRLNKDVKRRFKGGPMDSNQWALNIDYTRFGTDRDQLAARRLHFAKLCEHVEALQGVASAVVAIRCPRPGCKSGPHCLCGRHAIAAFKCIGTGANRRVLCRNSHGKKSPIIEVSPGNLAWWMSVDACIVKSWNSTGVEVPVPAETKWYAEHRVRVETTRAMVLSLAESMKAAGAAVHEGVSCDGSGQNPIVGPRFRLKGANYDLCEKEFGKLTEEQRADFERIDVPIVAGAQTKEVEGNTAVVVNVEPTPAPAPSPSPSPSPAPSPASDESEKLDNENVKKQGPVIAPTTLTVKAICPPNAKPGDVVTITIKDVGKVQIPLPKDAVPGHPFKLMLTKQKAPKAVMSEGSSE